MMNEKTPGILADHQKWITPSVVLSGFCWYLSCGLDGNSWYLLWIAPLPVLIISFYLPAKKAFSISFIAYLIGRLSWLSYLITVATVIPAIIFTLLLPLIFAVIILISRKLVLTTRFWSGIFAYPVFYTAYEFLLFRFSPDGTAGSIAYAQSDCLPVIQIASFTGILGITFLVTWIPSIIAVGWYHHTEKNIFRMALAIAAILFLSVFLMGSLRIKNGEAGKSLKAGLVALDEQDHHITDHPSLQDELKTTALYADEISRLASQGAVIAVLPERALILNSVTKDSIQQLLSRTAEKNHILVITGYTNYKNNPARNSALVIDKTGKVACDYNKVHLVRGFEQQFTPGKESGLFMVNDVHAGTAICKDLDFTVYMRKYGKASVGVLCVPAWDFVQDDWLHSRMAVLRGVENGFSVIRTARLGRLTISDCFGHVTYEASAAHKKKAVLLGNVSLQPVNTYYTQYGDWFGLLVIFAAFLFPLSITLINRKRSQ
jgi:apolipoprotein N-acyltransferase